MENRYRKQIWKTDMENRYGKQIWKTDMALPTQNHLLKNSVDGFDTAPTQNHLPKNFVDGFDTAPSGPQYNIILAGISIYIRPRRGLSRLKAPSGPSHCIVYKNHHPSIYTTPIHYDHLLLLSIIRPYRSGDGCREDCGDGSEGAQRMRPA